MICKEKFLVLLNPLNNIEITNYFNDEPRFNLVFSRNNLSRINDEAYVINLRTKERNLFHYLSTIIKLYTLTLLELNIFVKKYYTKSKINQLFKIYLEYKIMNLLCVGFIVSFSQTTCLHKKLHQIILINFLQMSIKRMTKYYKSI